MVNKLLIENIDRIHTTPLGIVRIKRNLELNVDDVVSWCCEKILDSSSSITKKGKNWYIVNDNCEITVNAHSYTIITAHKVKNNNIGGLNDY